MDALLGSTNGDKRPFEISVACRDALSAIKQPLCPLSRDRPSLVPANQLVLLQPLTMPNHYMADEKPETTPYGYEETNVGFEEPFVHGASTVGGETGRGGDTHRGLKSRHIQFL